MKTMGIDLASQPQGTAFCILSWGKERCDVEALVVPADNETLLAHAKHVDTVAVDAPIGWPQTFKALLSKAYLPTHWNEGLRDALRFRRTDFYIRKQMGRWPLSVSTDLIGVVALRCQTLLPHFSNCHEAYPAAALHRWVGHNAGYKKKAGLKLRKKLWENLRSQTPWLHMSSREEELCLHDDDAFDAWVVALVARAIAVGQVDSIPKEDLAAVAEEGWTHVPLEGSLKSLHVLPLAAGFNPRKQGTT